MKKSLKEQLPERFTERMESLLNDEYPVFLNSYDEKYLCRAAYEYIEDNAGGIFKNDRSGIGIGDLVSDGFLL